MGSKLNCCLRDETFRTCDRPNYLFTAAERPSHTIEVKLRLEKRIDTVLLEDIDLALDKDGMKIAKVDHCNNIITVIGIPPDYGYNAESVLAVVKKHDEKAEIVS